jgi:hypothetical protein
MQAREPGPVRVGVIVAAAVAALVASCDGEFTGPYPCNPGYASCSTSNQCETHVDDDPRACGSCGATCPLGALCAKGACAQAPPTLATDAIPSTLGINAANLFYWSMASTNSLVGLPKAGGPEFSVPTPNLWQQGQQGAPFAVDDTSVYYLGESFGAGPGTGLVESVPASVDTGAPPTVLATFPSSTQAAPSAMLLSNGTLYLTGGTSSAGSNESVVVSVPTSGGPFTSVATFPNAQGLAVDSRYVYAPVFPSGGEGQCAIDQAPISGGPASTLLDTENLGCPSILASDGTNVYFVESSTHYANDGSPNLCFLTFLSVPVGGGSAATLGEVQVDEQALQVAVDGSNVYAVTNQSAWKIAIDGGAASRIAGNLQIDSNTTGPGSTGGTSNGCSFSGTPISTSVAIALDDTSLYLAETSPTDGTGLLIKIPK